jgi:hypothetical protein
MNYINTKRLLLGIFIILLPVVVVSSSVYIFLRDSNDVRGVNSEGGERTVPYISNLPPRLAFVGREYIFVPKIISENPEITNLFLVEKPDWLFIDTSGVVRGTPYALGSFKVVFKVSDGYNSSTVVEYILVNE